MVAQQGNGSDVIEQILKGSTSTVQEALSKFESWTPMEQAFYLRKALHKGIEPTLRGESPSWDDQPVDEVIAMFDKCLQQYEQATSSQRSRRGVGSPS